MKSKKISCFISCVYAFFLIALPILCFAQRPTTAAEMGTVAPGPPPTDVSIEILKAIFGTVSGVFQSSGSQIFGVMFGIFNAAVLTLGMTILGYTLFVATLKTAHEGEVLGREWSSIWIPLKSAAGFALILPKASGYCIIQILTMHIVVQGVYAANLIWESALDYLEKGGAIVQPQQPSRIGSARMAGDIFRSEICMFMIEKALAQEKAAQGGTTASIIPSFLQSVVSPTQKTQPEYSVTAATSSIAFPGKLYNPDGTEFKNFYGACGHIKWGSAEADMKDPAQRQLAEARALGVLQVIGDLSGYANQVAADYGPFPDAKQALLATTLKNQPILLDAATGFEGIIGPALNALSGTFFSARGVTENAKKEGWIMAGTWYHQLVEMTRRYVRNVTTYPEGSFQLPSEDNFPDLPKTITTSPNFKTFFTIKGSDNPLSVYIDSQLAKASANVTEWEVLLNKGAVIGFDIAAGITGQIFSIFSFGISGIFQGFYQLMSQVGDIGQNPVSPVSAAAVLGSGFVNFVSDVWVLGAVTVFGITALTSICPAANPLPTATSAAIAWFVPLLTVVLVLMFVIGATLVYYIPLIPYILFLFGSIGWIIGVLESIAAAPIVAIGIAYPEEHAVLGKAQPAVMLLANIFIRPALMIIGFIGAISLSYVAVWLLNRGFSRAIFSIGFNIQGWAWVFMSIAVLAIYTALVVEVLNRAFSLIHVLPDEVLRWVGGGHRQLGAETSRAEEATRGAVVGDIKQGGQAMAQSVGEAMRAGGGRGAEGEEKLGARPGGSEGEGSEDEGIEPKTKKTKKTGIHLGD